MNNSYKQVPVFQATTRFDKAPQSSAERSRMTEATSVITAFNGGDIVPIKVLEVLPSETYGVKFEDVIRQTTLKTPTMGEMICDVFAFFVPNRIVNRSWVNVMGENSGDSLFDGTGVSLAPLYNSVGPDVKIPVGSVADYYGLPTQKALQASTLALMHDLVFRGYLSIYNEYFRDQNYQPIIPFSKENIYEGFLLPRNSSAGVRPNIVDLTVASDSDVMASGAVGGPSVIKDIYGSGASSNDFLTSGSGLVVPARRTSWSALDKPLKANKHHDALTSVLPSPQRGPALTFSLADSVPVKIPSNQNFMLRGGSRDNTQGLSFNSVAGTGSLDGNAVFSSYMGGASWVDGTAPGTGSGGPARLGAINGYLGAQLEGTADLSSVSAISVDDLRLGFAMQQLYELYGRSGSRYREICHAMFGIDVNDPFSDIPRLLGRVRFPLELFQTAQTSASNETSPQGNLAAFGYTNKGGFLFHETFLEHGYVHILCTVRQRNIYPAYLDPHWFRLNQLDFYSPVLANISEQPILLRTINPFSVNANKWVFGYQEAWWEYRQHPDIVTGLMRSAPTGTADLSLWTYQDQFDENQASADADFMESNAEEVLNNTLAVDSSNTPQFKALFRFYLDHEFPGPVYSVPGLDTL